MGAFLWAQVVTEFLAYLDSEKVRKSKIVVEDIQGLKEAGCLVPDVIDDFLRLAPRNDVLMKERNIKNQAVTAVRRPTSAGRQLEGAVSGEGLLLRAHGYRKCNYVQGTYNNSNDITLPWFGSTHSEHTWTRQRPVIIKLTQ